MIGLPSLSRSSLPLKIEPCHTQSDLRDNAGMPPDLMALFLLTGVLSAVTIATLMYAGFPRPETRFTLVVTLLLVSAVVTLAPLVFLPRLGARGPGHNCDPPGAGKNSPVLVARNAC